MSHCKSSSLTIVVASLLPSVNSPPASAQTSKLAFKEAIARDSLKTVVAISISPDGKFARAAAENDGAISIYERKAESESKK